MGDFEPRHPRRPDAEIVGTPPEVIERLNREIYAGLESPGLKARYADLGATPFAGSPADLGKFMAEDTEKWEKVIKFANIDPHPSVAKGYPSRTKLGVPRNI